MYLIARSEDPWVKPRRKTTNEHYACGGWYMMLATYDDLFALLTNATTILQKHLNSTTTAKQQRYNKGRHTKPTSRKVRLNPRQRRSENGCGKIVVLRDTPYVSSWVHPKPAIVLNERVMVIQHEEG